MVTTFVCGNPVAKITVKYFLMCHIQPLSLNLIKVSKTHTCVCECNGSSIIYDYNFLCLGLEYYSFQSILSLKKCFQNHDSNNDNVLVIRRKIKIQQPQRLLQQIETWNILRVFRKRLMTLDATIINFSKCTKFSTRSIFAYS